MPPGLVFISPFPSSICCAMSILLATAICHAGVSCCRQPTLQCYIQTCNQTGSRASLTLYLGQIGCAWVPAVAGILHDRRCHRQVQETACQSRHAASNAFSAAGLPIPWCGRHSWFLHRSLLPSCSFSICWGAV